MHTLLNNFLSISLSREPLRGGGLATAVSQWAHADSFSTGVKTVTLNDWPTNSPNNRGVRPSWVMAQKWESRYDNGILEAKAFSSDWLPILSQPDTKFGFLAVWEPPLSLYIQFLFVFPLAHIYFAYILFCITITTYYPHELLNWRSDWSECPVSTWVGTCQESHLPSEHSTLGTKRLWKMKQKLT